MANYHQLDISNVLGLRLIRRASTDYSIDMVDIDGRTPNGEAALAQISQSVI